MNSWCLCEERIVRGAPRLVPASLAFSSRMMGDVNVMVHDVAGSLSLVTITAASSTQILTSYFSSHTPWLHTHTEHTQ